MAESVKSTAGISDGATQHDGSEPATDLSWGDSESYAREWAEVRSLSISSFWVVHRSCGVRPGVVRLERHMDANIVRRLRCRAGVGGDAREHRPIQRPPEPLLRLHVHPPEHTLAAGPVDSYGPIRVLHIRRPGEYPNTIPAGPRHEPGHRSGILPDIRLNTTMEILPASACRRVSIHSGSLGRDPTGVVGFRFQSCIQQLRGVVIPIVYVANLGWCLDGTWDCP